MNTTRKRALAAVAIFVISHFLPAYDDGSGLACFLNCWGMLCGSYTHVTPGAWCYYSGFVLSSILFIGLVVAMFVTKQHRTLRTMISVACFLHVMSWLVLHIFPEPTEAARIKIGYYVWLNAYGFLVAAHFLKPSAGGAEAVPLVSPV